MCIRDRSSAIETNIVGRFHLHAQLRDYFSIYSYQSGRDIFVSIPARADAGIGNKPVQAHFSISSPFLGASSDNRLLSLRRGLLPLFEDNYFCLLYTSRCV